MSTVGLGPVMVPEPTGPVGGSQASVTKKKRVLTEARRQQNRAAQKLYRQRRKEQSLLLPKKPKPTGQRELRPRPVKATEKDDPSNGSLAQLGSGGEEFPTAEDVQVNEGGAGLMHWDTDTSHSTNSPDDLTAAVIEGLVLTEPGSLDQYGTMHSNNEIFGEDHSATEQLPSSTDILDIQRPSLPLRSSRKHNTFMSKRVQALANPYANSLEFLQTTIFSAILQNAVCLGFDLSSLAACSFNQGSPFYRPDVTLQDNPVKLFNRYLSSLDGPHAAQAVTTPPHLRPSLVQFLVPHHISFDLIPIPLLRDRAIMLSMAMPHTFNVGEIKLDIYEHGGLAVWKGSGHAGACQPWEMGSWEAAPWFLRKWSMAVDGEDGELGRQSSQWQSLRSKQMGSLQAIPRTWATEPVGFCSDL